MKETFIILGIFIFLGVLGSVYRLGQRSVNQGECEGIIYVASTCDD